MKKYLAGVLLLLSINGLIITQASARNSSSFIFPESIKQKITNRQRLDLKDQIEKIAENAPGRIGVAAQLMETGETVFFNSEERFPMQSVYKLPIGMTVLSQADSGQIKLNQIVHIDKKDILKNSRIISMETSPNGADKRLKNCSN